MKIRSISLLLFIGLGLVIAFSNVKRGKENPSEKDFPATSLQGLSGPEKTICIVLIDPTMPLQEGGLKKMARSVYQITKALPENSVIEIRQIDDNPYLAPWASYTVPPSPVSPPSAIRAYPLKVDNNAKMLGESVFRQLKEIKAQTPDSIAKSCIVRGLETAYNALKHYSPSDYRWEIILVSDMVEECDNSPVGKLFMTPEGYKHALKGVDTYQADFDLSHADLSVLVVRDYQPGDPSYLQPEHLQQLWETVFTKVGYSSEEIDRMYFGSTIPPRFQGGVGR